MIARASRPLPLPPVALTVAIWAAVSCLLVPREANDVAAFVVPWFDHIATLGPVAAFAQPFSNYAPPYLYLLALATVLHGTVPALATVKLVSLLGTLALAMATRGLLRALDAPQPGRAAALVLLVPTVLFNGALLGQCDAFWTAACVMALTAAIGRRHAAMLAWFGLALGFKVQALLIAPLFVALLINRRVPWRLWGIAPATAAATMVPAWLAGWPAVVLTTVVLRQAATYPALSSRAPNLWSVAQALPWIGDLPLTGLATAAAIGASAAYIAWFSARPLHGRAVVEAGLLCVLMTAGLAPRMHDRYFFLADVLAVVVALTTRGRDQVRRALLVQAGSMLALLAYRSPIESAAALGAVPMILATALLARALLAPAANDNPLMARAA